MGCDYYILIMLHIYYNDNEYVEIELDREKGYYNYEIDEDEYNYKEKVEEYKKHILIPIMNPILIYNKNYLRTLSSELKYKTLVENEIKKYDKQWDDITKIIKVEVRIQR